MRKYLVLLALLGLMFLPVPIQAATVIHDGGNVISVDDGGGSLTVDGTLVDTGALSDTVFMDSMAINPYTEVTKALTGVKQIRLKARSGIDVRIATGTGSSTATTYEILYAGSEMIIKNLNGISVTIAAMGNDATASDTGTLSIMYCQ